MDLLRTDAELPCQVGDPPLILPHEIVAEQFPDETQITHQVADPRRAESAAAARRDEALGVEPLGDLCEAKSLAVHLCNTLRQVPNVAQLCINRNWPGDLVAGREAALPHDRHV